MGGREGGSDHSHGNMLHYTYGSNAFVELYDWMMDDYDKGPRICCTTTVVVILR